MPERRPRERREDRMIVLRKPAPKPERDQPVPQVSRKRDPAGSGRGLRRPVLPRSGPLTANVQETGVLVEVLPPQPQRLALPQPEQRHQPQERRVVVLRFSL